MSGQCVGKSRIKVMYHNFYLFIPPGYEHKKRGLRGAKEAQNTTCRRRNMRSNNERTVSNILPVDFAFVFIILCACPHFYLLRIISKLFYTLSPGTWEALNGFRVTKSGALLLGMGGGVSLPSSHRQILLLPTPRSPNPEERPWCAHHGRSISHQDGGL